VPSAPKAAITGVSATESEPVDEKEWTPEELKAGKPLFVYYYVEGMDASNGADDQSFKFAQSFEMGGLGEKVINELNDNWRAKKVGLDLDADRKQAKNQARIEFWSFTGTKMGDITIKEQSMLNPGTLKAKLKGMRTMNSDLAAKEIKRIEDAAKARAKAEKAADAKPAASK
jgi:hypothetical protein